MWASRRHPGFEGARKGGSTQDVRGLLCYARAKPTSPHSNGRAERNGGKGGCVSRAAICLPWASYEGQSIHPSTAATREERGQNETIMFSSQPDTFSPSQNAADSTTPSKVRGASSTMPLTVKQIADAQQSCTGQKGAPFVVDGVETTNIRLVGVVNGKAERTTDVSFTLDDGTPRLDFIRWVNDASDSTETAVFQNGMYISVIGSLKGLQERKRATAFSIRPVTDFNEVTLHFIQCVRMHLVNTKSKVSGPAQTSSFSNGFSESSTPTSSKSNPAPVNSGTNGSETDLYTQVLNVFHEPAIVESEHGVHIDEIAKRLRLPASKIKEAIEYHVDVGHIYSTIDDFHFKSALID